MGSAIKLELRRLRNILIFVFVALLASSVFAQEVIYPASEEIDLPIIKRRMWMAPSDTSVTAAKTQPFLTPVSKKVYREMKEAAKGNPFALDADSLEAPSGAEPLAPEPLASDVTTSFTGLDRPGATNNGFVFYPPDTVVAKSYTRVLEGVNSALRLFTTAGSTLQTMDFNTFFSASTADGLLFDPKVYFDRNATYKRFYVVALQKKKTSPTSGVSLVWYAISRSSDPANLNPANWCRYSFSGRWNVGTADESWADYPGLGMGADALLISVNQFRFSNDSFTYAIVHAFNKATASNNAAGCPAIARSAFKPSGTIGDGTAFTLQPVQHYSSPSSFTGTTNPAYLLSTIWGTNNVYRVWQMRNVASAPSLRSVNVTGSFTYGLQPDAPQFGDPSLLDTGDNRMMQAAGIGNSLSGTHATLCDVGSDSSNESCIRVVRVTVGQSSGNLTASISQQRTFGRLNNFFFWPGIAVNSAQQTVVPFHRSCPSCYLSSYWTMKDSSSISFEPMSPLTAGTCSQTLSNRTGDYIGAQTDPSDFNSFWLAGERATTISTSCQWQTRIIKVTPGTDIINFNP